MSSPGTSTYSGLSLVLASVLGLNSLSGCYSMHRAAMQLEGNKFANDPESVTQGARLYDFHCAGCHGAEGQGDGPDAQELELNAPSLIEYAKLHSDRDIAARILSGSFAGMPQHIDSLSQEEAWHLVNFIRSLP